MTHNAIDKSLGVLCACPDKSVGYFLRVLLRFKKSCELSYEMQNRRGPELIHAESFRGFADF